MNDPAEVTRFTGSPLIVGVFPGQDPAVWQRALDLSESLSAPLLAAFVDPTSYLIEWTPGNDVLPISLEPVIDPEGEAAIAAAELKEVLERAATGYVTQWSLRIIGGDPARALGRLAAAERASTIIVGTRRPGFLAKVEEIFAGSIIDRLLTTQHIPVLAVPSANVQHHFHSHG